MSGAKRMVGKKSRLPVVGYVVSNMFSNRVCGAPDVLRCYTHASARHAVWVFTRAGAEAWIAWRKVEWVDYGDLPYRIIPIVRRSPAR